MAIPSCTYLKLRIPRPAKIITVEAQMHRALNYEQSNIELATATVVMDELRELNLRLPMTAHNPGMPLTFDACKADEDAKVMQIDTEILAKTV
jgi:hypothetical protein